MTLQWSAEENIIFYAHIARHQLQSLSTDHHLPDVYKRLRIGRFVASEGYVSVVLPSISQAIKSRMRILNENEDTRPFLQGVVHGTRIRFYPAFMDAWAKPGWIGDMKKPRSEEAAEDDDDHTVSSERTEPMPTPPVPPALGDNAPSCRLSAPGECPHRHYRPLVPGHRKPNNIVEIQHTGNGGSLLWLGISLPSRGARRTT
ncbi:hypothetical protein Ct61P_15458 [Colletotrichum tofieldiae]|nr:hypothetical protein Ct61P_15458 [Colletotrichum tofieldiae]